ncbi:hypothetical protein QTO34_006441 [Cnephaeus nilssonii]|uniref:60S ribosomal protein L21 n=1 Tax=Cnephaeus nilssonii TaxID=3371016 RepID=A0AA40LHG2_CNENI|nr:hypothetical protein QTO34_006441 [Eptesicus nilssonii]
MPNLGYGSSTETKHVLPSGFRKFLVHTVKELEVLLMCNKCYCAERLTRLLKEPQSHCGKGSQLAIRVYATQHAVGIAVNKQVKGKILAKRVNVHLEHIKLSKSRDSLLKRVKENDRKKKEAKETGTWVHLKRQPAPPREARFVRANGKEPELLEHIPCEFIA